jgi:anthranilate phosphoribosyltransferase
MIKEVLAKLVEKKDLSEEEARGSMQEIMDGQATPSQIAAFLMALRLKGETVAEITGCARVMREKAVKVKIESKTILDTCGTGGDARHTFNISTVSALVVAGAGVTVAKHGNRSISSKCGSADLLEKLGVKIDASVEIVEKCLKEADIGFLFAPLFHPAMKYAMPTRQELGLRTIFNILGPLTNPCQASCQLMGVYDGKLTETLVRVLKALGSRRAFVVHGEDGLDEVTTTNSTRISELSSSGEIKTYLFNPEELGIKRTSLLDLSGGDVIENVKITEGILQGEKGPRRDIVLINAAFGLVAAGKANDLKEGIKLASTSIDSGQAREKLLKLKSISNRLRRKEL